jgi:competence transcription factor ComK
LYLESSTRSWALANGHCGHHLPYDMTKEIRNTYITHKAPMIIHPAYQTFLKRSRRI